MLAELIFWEGEVLPIVHEQSEKMKSQELGHIFVMRQE